MWSDRARLVPLLNAYPIMLINQSTISTLLIINNSCLPAWTLSCQDEGLQQSIPVVLQAQYVWSEVFSPCICAFDGPSCISLLVVLACVQAQQGDRVACKGNELTDVSIVGLGASTQIVPPLTTRTAILYTRSVIFLLRDLSSLRMSVVSSMLRRCPENSVNSQALPPTPHQALSRPPLPYCTATPFVSTLPSLASPPFNLELARVWRADSGNARAVLAYRFVVRNVKLG